MFPALALFLSSFLLYLITLNGTTPAYRDSGDLISAVSTLGIAHPPGYPLYVLMGKLFTQAVPFANVAYRVNLFSALCAAGAVGLLYLILRRFWPVGIAVLVAVLFAVSPALVSLARVAEMYTLAGLIGAGILACYFMNTSGSILLGCFLVGCGFGVHPTLLFLSPLFFTLKPREATQRAGCFLLGFSIVLFLLVRSSAHPVQNWGNPSTLTDLWRLISRSNYGGLKLHPEESEFSWTLGGAFAQCLYFLKSLLAQWGWPGVIAGGFGLAAAWKQRRTTAIRLGSSWLLAGPLFFLLSNLPLSENTTAPILQPYLILVNLLWALWVAQGLAAAWGYIPLPAVRAVLLLIVAVVPLYALRTSFRSFRDHFYAYDLGRNMLRTLPPRAVLFDPDDPVAFTVRVLQVTEGRRDDIALLNFFRTYWGYKQISQRWPDLLPGGEIRSGQELERILWTYSLRQRPFFADLPMKIPPSLGYRVDGIVYPVIPAPARPTPEELQRTEGWLQLYSWRGSWRTTDHLDFFTKQVLNYRSAAYCNLGLKYAERKDWLSARWCYRLALTIDPRLSVAYNNLGVADYQQGRYPDAVKNYQQALLYDPSNPGYRQNLALAEQQLK